MNCEAGCNLWWAAWVAAVRFFVTSVVHRQVRSLLESRAMPSTRLVPFLALALIGCGASPNISPIPADAASVADAAPDASIDAAPPLGLNWPAGQSFPSFAPFWTLDVVDLDGAMPDEVTLIVTLAGVVNKRQPRIYPAKGEAEGKTFWLDKLGATQNAVANRLSMLTKYASEVAGIVVTDDAQPDTINLATTLAGVHGGVVASPRLAAQLTAAPYNLPVLADLRTNHFTSKLAVYQYALAQLGGTQTTTRLIVGLNPAIAGGPRDLAVATAAMVVWLDPTVPAELSLLDQFLTRLEPNSPYVGWWTNEGAGVAAASRHAVPVFAADFSVNLSVLGGSPRGTQVPAPPARPPLANKIYVAIFMSDGDNLQEDQHLIPLKWADPNRGRVPIAWTIDPALVDAAPIILDYFWRTATPNDVLVSGPSGLGYTYPANWPTAAFDEYTFRTSAYMNAAGLRCITIWNNGSDLSSADATSYARNLPRTLGVTMQSSSSAFQLLGGTLPMVRFAVSYGPTAAALESGIDAAAAGWPGTSPRFIAVQGNMNQAAITPTAFYEVQQHYAANASIQFVRADHFFQLVRQANGLPIDPQ
jgi:hypothetical protein